MTKIETELLKEEVVPLKSRIWVSLGDAACGTLQGFIGGGALTYYFTRFRGLEPEAAALIWLIFGLWNAVNDPLFGFLSDQTKNKLGRRIPYIRFGAPLITVMFILTWINFPGTMNDQTFLFIQMLACLFFYDILYTAIATSLYVMPFEMAVSNKARSSIFLWKIIFSVFSLAIPLVLFDMIKPGPGEDATQFQVIMTTLGLVMGVLIFSGTYFYKENHYHQEEEQLPFFKSLKETFSNISFLVFEVLSFTVIFVQTGLMQGIYYYFDELQVSAIPCYLALVVGVVVGVAGFMRMQEVWGVKKSTRLMTLLFGMGCFLVAGLGRFFIPVLIGFFLFGIGFAGGMYLIPLMNGDVVDNDEFRTGLRREGIYAGVNSFITKPAISIAQAVFLWFLGAFGYDQQLEKGLQSTSAETGILLGWTLVPGILLLVSFLALKFYPLAGEEWRTIKEKLSKVHQDKERAFLEAKGYKFVE